MEFGALPEAFEAAKPIRSPNHCREIHVFGGFP